MKNYTIPLITIIFPVIALFFSGCGSGGGIPTTPVIPDYGIDEENVEEEKIFQLDADKGGSFSLSDGTELKIDPGDLSNDGYVVLKKVRCSDLDFTKSWWANENPYAWIVDIIDCGDLLSNAELYIASENLNYIGGEISGGIIKLKDNTFEFVTDFVLSEGERAQVNVTEIGQSVYLFATMPVNQTLMLNDLVSDISKALQYYSNDDCTSLNNLYQQALQEEDEAKDDLADYPGISINDTEEIFDIIDNLETVITFSAGLAPQKSVILTAYTAYKIYSFVMALGELCQYSNVYTIHKYLSDLYSCAIFKRRVIGYLYEEGCDDEAAILLLLNKFDNAIDQMNWSKALQYCVYWSPAYQSVLFLDIQFQNLEDICNDISITGQSTYDEVIFLDDNRAKVSASGSATIYCTPPGEEQISVTTSGESITYLEKTSEGWKITSGGLVDYVSDVNME
jgi:hypothetical protein